MGQAIVWSAAWAAVGALLVGVAWLVDPASVDTGEGPLQAMLVFGRAGAVAGVAASAVLAVLERRRSLRELRLPRVAVYGALGAAALPWLIGAPTAMLPVFALLGAGCSAGTVALARRPLLHP